MRLLNVKTLKLEEHETDIPTYAILSHTWGNDEVLFADVVRGTAKNKKAWQKIKNCCAVAKSHGWTHVWIDTCCIDRTSSAELSEAINSMYKWYNQSGVCYAYLSDVPKGTQHHWSRSSPFQQSRWFTRGWTLQELLAPGHVLFFNQAWQEIGTRSSLSAEIEHVTGIADHDMANLDLISVATKLSWASGRQTTRIEDEAYCLMGLFNVNMPLIYGEGRKAFYRLQLEIMSATADESLFAWTIPSEYQDAYSGLLAPSPAAFATSSSIVPLKRPNTRPEYTMTQKGLRVELDLYPHVVSMPILDSNYDTFVTPLSCAWIGQTAARVGIIMQRGADDSEFFRPPQAPLISWSGSNEVPSRQLLYIRQWQQIEPEHKWFVVSFTLPPQIELDTTFSASSISQWAKIGNEFHGSLRPRDYLSGVPLFVRVLHNRKKVEKLLYLALIKRDEFLMMALAERPVDSPTNEFQSTIAGMLTRQMARPIEEASLAFNTGHSISVSARPVPVEQGVYDSTYNISRKFHLDFKLLKTTKRGGSRGTGTGTSGGGSGGSTAPMYVNEEAMTPPSTFGFGFSPPKLSRAPLGSITSEVIARRWALLRNTTRWPFAALAGARPRFDSIAVQRFLHTKGSKTSLPSSSSSSSSSSPLPQLRYKEPFKRLAKVPTITISSCDMPIHSKHKVFPARIPRRFPTRIP